MQAEEVAEGICPELSSSKLSALLPARPGDLLDVLATALRQAITHQDCASLFIVTQFDRQIPIWNGFIGE